MIDRVNLNRLISQALETDKRIRRKEEVAQTSGADNNRDIVDISEAARKALEVDYQDLSNKVKRLKEEISKGTYEVSADKIIEGLKKFFSS